MGQSNTNYKFGQMAKFNLCFNIVQRISVMVLIITFCCVVSSFSRCVQTIVGLNEKHEKKYSITDYFPFNRAKMWQNKTFLRYQWVNLRKMEDASWFPGIWIFHQFAITFIFRYFVQPCPSLENEKHYILFQFTLSILSQLLFEDKTGLKEINPS